MVTEKNKGQEGNVKLVGGGRKIECRILEPKDIPEELRTLLENHALPTSEDNHPPQKESISQAPNEVNIERRVSLVEIQRGEGTRIFCYVEDSYGTTKGKNNSLYELDNGVLKPVSYYTEGQAWNLLGF